MSASQPAAYVIEAQLVLADGVDPAGVGAAVTTALCGHWEHEGACRWPHNSSIDAACVPARFRTLFVADAADAAAVRDEIEVALRGAGACRVVSIGSRPVAQDEHALAERLRTGPRAAP